MGKNDRFADIAASGIAADKAGLVEKPVRKPETRLLPWNEPILDSALFEAPTDPQEALRQEMDRLRTRYLPFLEDHAPRLTNRRIRTELQDFQWRRVTAEDRKDFSAVVRGAGNWEAVSIPHFSGPLGQAETLYRTVFSADTLPQAGEALFLHFCGVDYVAHVFLNGTLLGSHRGAFAAFEFDCTPCLRQGENILIVRVENDFSQDGCRSEESEALHTGEKLYASGPGYDDPEIGWHHAPPGMGIWQRVWLELRPRQYIDEVYARPLCKENGMELQIRARSCDAAELPVSFRISVYGKNFPATVVEDLPYVPQTGRAVGMGDTFTEAKVHAQGLEDVPVPMELQKGQNDFILFVPLGHFRWWSPEEPWLYEAQVQLLDAAGTVVDSQSGTFGMRTFTMDQEGSQRGAMYLNGNRIRLRGANTMGFEQQDIMRGDFAQLAEDILLARACNMNFLRITQRPVQKEFYDYCDRLGLLIQTDMPVTFALPRSQLVEGVRQAKEMEHLVRSHPCVILCTYMNEPFPNALNQPHRNLNRAMMEQYFQMADMVVRFENPDRVTKHTDGDYDPPSQTMPDYHCYTAWYNGHGVDFGALHKGDWLPLHPDWYYYGCGEFGAEGLEDIALMRERYPAHWLPQTPEEEACWSPNSIVNAQTGCFHYFFFETPNTLEEWVARSQEHQAEATKWMTEAFRRNDHMASFAIHLFIDTWPSGWMKSIVDCRRVPKPAFYAYRDALTPTMVSLRTDRLSAFSGEEAAVELWLCNDLPQALEGTRLCYEVQFPDGRRQQGMVSCELSGSTAAYGGEIRFELPEPGSVRIRCALLGEDGTVLHRNTLQLQVWPKQAEPPALLLHTPNKNGPAAQLIRAMGTTAVSPEAASCVLFDCWDSYVREKNRWDQLAASGKHLVFLDLPAGTYDLCGHSIAVKESSMMGAHFLSRDTGHPWVRDFDRKAFRHWYDPELDRISVLTDRTFTCQSLTPVLTSGNTDEDSHWGPALSAATGPAGAGTVTLCQLHLERFVSHNPAARLFALRMLGA